MNKNWSILLGWLAILTGFTASGPCARAEDALHWRADGEVLDANLNRAPLVGTLEWLATETGWHIYLEPESSRTITTKFTGLSRGEAVRVLIGDLNYAFVPQVNGPTKLFIFRTSLDAATLEVQRKPKPAVPTLKRVPNQLVVTLKPGVKIEDIARKMGAKVKARIGDLNAYLLEFDSNEAVEAARKELATDEDVTSVDYNYYVDRPVDPRPVTGNAPPPVRLSLNPRSADGRVIIGLIDTGLQSLSPELQKFLLAQISVAGSANPSDLPTHGTSMAETILRALQAATGGSTSVQILPVDVYGPNASTTTFDVANGIIRAVNGGATLINLSLGSESESTFLHSVITEVTGQQVAVFGAAGNQPVTTPFYPAAYPEVIAVTASGGQGQVANYANHGSFVDMMAPGSSVVYYNNQPWLVTGTSAASAYAAGLAAGIADARSLSAVDAANTVITSLPFPNPATSGTPR
jgi:hypothetical protein